MGYPPNLLENKNHICCGTDRKIKNMKVYERLSWGNGKEISKPLLGRSTPIIQSPINAEEPRVGP